MGSQTKPSAWACPGFLTQLPNPASNQEGKKMVDQTIQNKIVTTKSPALKKVPTLRGTHLLMDLLVLGFLKLFN